MNIELRITGVDSIPASLPEVEKIISANMSCDDVQKLTVKIKAFSPVRKASQYAVIRECTANLWTELPLGSIKIPVAYFDSHCEDLDSYELVVTVEKAR